MGKQTYGRTAYRQTKRNFAIMFFSLSVLSLAFVSGLAVLSRAQLRLSGEILAADERDLALMEELKPFERVELIRETADLKLYILERDGKKYLAEIVRDESARSEDSVGRGKWRVESVEKLHQ